MNLLTAHVPDYFVERLFFRSTSVHNKKKPNTIIQAKLFCIGALEFHPQTNAIFICCFFFSRSTEVTIFIMLSLLFFVCVSHLFVWIGPREKKLLNRIEPYLRQSKDTIYGQTIVYNFFSLSTQVSALFDKFRINLYTLK